MSKKKEERQCSRCGLIGFFKDADEKKCIIKKVDKNGQEVLYCKACWDKVKSKAGRRKPQVKKPEEVPAETPKEEPKEEVKKEPKEEVPEASNQQTDQQTEESLEQTETVDALEQKQEVEPKKKTAKKKELSEAQTEEYEYFQKITDFVKENFEMNKGIIPNYALVISILNNIKKRYCHNNGTPLTNKEIYRTIFYMFNYRDIPPRSFETEVEMYSIGNYVGEALRFWKSVDRSRDNAYINNDMNNSFERAQIITIKRSQLDYGDELFQREYRKRYNYVEYNDFSDIIDDEEIEADLQSIIHAHDAKLENDFF